MPYSILERERGQVALVLCRRRWRGHIGFFIFLLRDKEGRRNGLSRELWGSGMGGHWGCILACMMGVWGFLGGVLPFKLYLGELPPSPLSLAIGCGSGESP